MPRLTPGSSAPRSSTARFAIFLTGYEISYFSLPERLTFLTYTRGIPRKQPSDQVTYRNERPGVANSLRDEGRGACVRVLLCPDEAHGAVLQMRWACHEPQIRASERHCEKVLSRVFTEHNIVNMVISGTIPNLPPICKK